VSGRAVFLDRDGVLNAALERDGRPHPPTGPDELAILPGVPAALAELRRAGFLLLVVTNQPDVARGATTASAVEAIHAALRAALPLDGIYCCFHDDGDRCLCRKPAPGLLVEAARAWDVDLSRSFMVGDRWRDTEAGLAAGCRTVFVDRAWRERRPERWDARVGSLAEAAAWILQGDTR
jgi:D-glycero-D-manno-heptose 1,7-bisphosphate phosphatase